MHRWHSDLLHRETSTWCNSRRNHSGSSDISPRHLHGEVCFCGYGTDKWSGPHPDSHDAFSQWQEILSHDAGKIYRCQSSVTYAFTLPSVTCPWTQPCTHSEKLKSYPTYIWHLRCLATKSEFNGWMLCYSCLTVKKKFSAKVGGILVIMKNYKSLFAKSFDLGRNFNFMEGFIANVLVIITLVALLHFSPKEL